ncbi:MAG TPA: ParB/RepB/Spo0J family partition protein [Candidatus Saccharimonadales bacterium]|nr:ParB/RepB/Spo0J family partition protein [Candidatus Saccharimonadales bacterium]
MATNKKTGLGRGFEALLPQDFNRELVLEPGEKVQKIALDKLHPNEYQPRVHFDETALEELASSIRHFGVVQPLVVSPDTHDTYSIIAGERRWRASKIAGLSHVPVIVRSSKELEQLEIAILENVQRVDLSALEQAASIERLHREFGARYDDIAKRLGKAPSTVNNIVRLLQLPQAAMDALATNKISEGHARAILSLKEQPEIQHRLLELIVGQQWSVRQAERYVAAHKDGLDNEQTAHARVHTENPVTKALSKKIGTKVSVRRMAKGGRLEISFKTDDELTKIIQLLDR